MKNNHSNALKNWARVAIIAGLLSLFSYFFSIVLKPFPIIIGRILFFAIGPLSIISVFSLYKLLRTQINSISLQLGTIFHIIAGAILNMMAVVQASQFYTIGNQIKSASDEASKEILTKIMWGVNVVQSGLDISWDIFISIGTVFLGVALMQHKRFGKLIGWLGIIIASTALIFNLYTFPASPVDADLIDLGPGIGLWYLLVIFILMRIYETINSDNESSSDA
jgi:hypothetical protein